MHTTDLLLLDRELGIGVTYIGFLGFKMRPPVQLLDKTYFSGNIVISNITRCLLYCLKPAHKKLYLNGFV